MKTFTLLVFLLAAVLCQPVYAQTKAPAKPDAAKSAPSSAQPAAPAPAAPMVAAAPPALITDKMADPAPNNGPLKVRLDANPLTKRLTVRTDAAGPTRVEVNDPEGRPVLTRDIMVGTDAAVLDVSNLPPGSYIVQCSSGERRGMKRVLLGQ
ncbi:T9SS type A sorting domain-containing protein [Hymenobacter weizhouensis]|uniref:T9SS type A sorting domain-containing protein n=1 Tax=Hymenobacter sp. YIM 151500-1 TaxID=2987689 RepID=UPI002226513C|nr:T9SS type A sorting domain-containing protein [Hymenobacter sp. YIM 151500-1]UYZ62171.1 T9SS type A sorting domain-containing protein [Hymenobacter sp. YIM 151500-1]